MQSLYLSHFKLSQELILMLGCIGLPAGASVFPSLQTLSRTHYLNAVFLTSPHLLFMLYASCFCDKSKVCLKVIQEHKLLKSYKIVKIIPQILRGNRQCHRSGKEARTVDICTEHGWRFSLSPLYKPYIERIPYRAFMYYNAI